MLVISNMFNWYFNCPLWISRGNIWYILCFLQLIPLGTGSDFARTLSWLVCAFQRGLVWYHFYLFTFVIIIISCYRWLTDCFFSCNRKNDPVQAIERIYRGSLSSILFFCSPLWYAFFTQEMDMFSVYSPFCV